MPWPGSAASSSATSRVAAITSPTETAWIHTTGPALRKGGQPRRHGSKALSQAFAVAALPQHAPAPYRRGDRKSKREREAVEEHHSCDFAAPPSSRAGKPNFTLFRAPTDNGSMVWAAS